MQANPLLCNKKVFKILPQNYQCEMELSKKKEKTNEMVQHGIRIILNRIQMHVSNLHLITFSKY